MHKSWPMNSRRVALGLPNNVTARRVRWVNPDGFSMRAFSMPASVWLAGGEWYRPRRGVSMRWDGPAYVARNRQTWFWNNRRVAEKDHRWRRRKFFLPVLHGVPLAPVIFAAL